MRTLLVVTTQCMVKHKRAVDVKCADCHRYVGEMTPDVFTRALYYSLSRGGIKCPDCRALSCKLCGRRDSKTEGRVQHSFHALLERDVSETLGEDFCKICEADYLSGPYELEQLRAARRVRYSSSVTKLVVL
jgi:hypothetical protein